MWKRLIIPLLFCIAFIVSTCIFWYLLRGFYDNPFIWTRFNNDFNFSLIPLGFSLVAMIFFSSLLTLVKPRSKLVYGVYVIAAATMVFFLPSTILTIGAALVFAIGFMSYEWSTNKLFHSYIKINFWDTYTKTIPTLITFLTVVMAMGQFQASIDNLDKLKIAIPTILVEKAFDSMSQEDKNVKGARTSYIAQAPDPAEIDELINTQLIQFGITDPAEQELYRKQVKQQMGLIPQTNYASPSATPQPQVASSSAVRNPVAERVESFVGFNQIQDNYRAQLVNQLKTQLENQINQLIVQYRMYIPAINAVAIFFLLSILNLPVMLLSIALVVMVMSILRFLRIIDVIKVKMDVERLAW